MRLSMVGRIVRRRWRLLAVLAVLGGLVGAGASLLFSPGYQTSTSVLLRNPQESSELLTEAQVAMSSVVLDRAAAALGWNVAGAELKKSVTAEVADGNVIKITGTADTPERAKRLTDQVAQEYISFSTQLASNTADASAQVAREQREALRQAIAQTNERIGELHASVQGLTIESVEVRTELESLRTALTDAMNKLDQTDGAAGQANLVVMEQARRPTSPAAPTMVQFVIAGALLFFVLGVFGHFVAARADRRLRNEPEIAAAIGSPVLASVDVPDEPPADEHPAGPTPWRTQLWRLIRDDLPWDVPRLQVSGDEVSREIRLRRVLARLEGGSHAARRVLLLVADGDATARAAAEQLAAMAGADRDCRTVLGVVGVAASRPTVPDDASVSGAVVVLTTGTRTAWELVGIAEACADAGHAVLGTVVTYPARPAGRGRRRRQDEPEVPVEDSAMAGTP